MAMEQVKSNVENAAVTLKREICMGLFFLLKIDLL